MFSRSLVVQLRRSYATLGNRYSDKVVIVTGAGKGIGRGVAEAFSKQSSKVIVADISIDAGENAVADIQEQGGHAEFIQCDVSSKTALQELVDTTVSRHNRLDCVVNNAGWHPPHYPIDDFTEQQCWDLMQLNFMSAYSLSRLSLPHLRKTQGNIINMGSITGERGQLEATTYAATKGAITAFSKALAIDEAKYNVRVNVIAPGHTWTPLWVAACSPDPAILGKAYREATQQQVLGRLGTTKEAGDMAVFIAAEATFTTGHVFLMTGGGELGFGFKLDVEGRDLDPNNMPK